MPLIYDANSITPMYAQVTEFASDRAARDSNPSAYETSRHTFSQVKFGNVVYPLRRPLSAMYLRSKEELLVDGLSPDLMGHGESASKAIEDFALNFHQCIQSLIFKRDFELTGEERILWQKINNTVDVTVFRNRTPLVVQHYGIVGHGTVSYPSRICLLYTSPSPRDATLSRMPSSA